MARPALILAVLALAVGVAGAAPAGDARLRVESCDGFLDTRELRRLLHLELRAAAARPDVRVTCTAEESAVDLKVGEHEERVPLRMVRRTARTRALALLAVESLRRERALPPEKVLVEPPQASAAPAAKPEPVKAEPAEPVKVEAPARAPLTLVLPSTPARPNHRRLYGGLALGLFVGGVAAFALAGTFAGLSADDTRSDTRALTTSGLTFIGVGTAVTISSAVMLGFYIRERRHR